MKARRSFKVGIPAVEISNILSSALKQSDRHDPAAERILRGETFCSNGAR